MKRVKSTVLSGILAAALMSMFPAISHAISFDISWTGSANFTMTGMFSYNDGLINTGAIDETDIDTFMIEGFENGSSIGSWNLADGLGAGAQAFNFNFNTTTEIFIVGNNTNTQTGQGWNFPVNFAVGASGFGFGSGSGGQSLTVDGISKGFIAINEPTLTATRKSTAPIPEPSTLLLFGTGILGLLGYASRRKRRKHAAA